MATTLRPVEILISGMRDSAGAVLASGKARFYQPGTLTQQTVYQDAAAATPYTQPVTLSAAGTKAVYTLEPVRLICKDSTDSTTVYDDVVNLVRHDYTYVTHTSFNGGAETTLENILTSLGTNLGTDGNYKESAGATAIAYSTFLGQICVSVTNFNAQGDGTTDDTTQIQAAYDRVAARGGGWVFFPKGTYKVTSAISITTAGVSTFGAGRGIAVVKNFSTTGNAFTINISGDSKMVMRDFSITANTTSSGTGISFTSGDNARLQNIGVGLHRTGYSCSAVTGTVMRETNVDSTDNNAAAVGVTLGARARIHDSEIISGTANGTGITAGAADCRVSDCYTSKFVTGITASGTNCQVNDTHVNGAGTTGITLSGTNAQAKGCEVLISGTTGIAASGTEATVRDCLIDTHTTGVSLTGARAQCIGSTLLTNTTGISLGVASSMARNNVVRASTTGFSVGAFANCVVVGNLVSGNTTDLSVNASATGLIEHSNNFSTLSDSALTPHSWLKDRGKVARVTKVTDSTTTAAFTPTPTTCDIYVCNCTSAGAMGSITINATATTGLVDRQRFAVVVQRTAGSATPAITWNAQYIGAGAATIGGTQYVFASFVWSATGSAWVCEAPNASPSAVNGSSW